MTDRSSKTESLANDLAILEDFLHEFPTGPTAKAFDRERQAFARIKAALQVETSREHAGPTWTCPNCGAVDEFSVQHEELKEEGNRVVTMLTCHACELKCTDARSETPQLKTTTSRADTDFTSDTGFPDEVP